ncbi:hypothetical protein BDV24DRAFT_165408 [Aspergillus arachidicola]|uniref:Phytanoyl-CoA dioxygenase n=1 Tax=Aspergillus arachidicola TaxID=656916 RepID=A0A5N6Y1X4_9EURO|nr:hypothetical protein BDV24DRAFT_165408 [Aspergillus arachidicola]
MLTHVRLALSEAGPKDGGLVVMEGSAPLFEKFFKEFPPDRTKRPLAALHYDFYPFQDEDLKWYEARGCKVIKVCAEPGDLVLWDSRQMHYSDRRESGAARPVGKARIYIRTCTDGSTVDSHYNQHQSQF